MDVLRAPNEQSGRVLTRDGSPIAWRSADDEDQLLRWRRELTRLGHHVSVVRDRKYFNSIYYREPGGILFEIATDSPDHSGNGGSDGTRARDLLRDSQAFFPT